MPPIRYLNRPQDELRQIPLTSQCLPWASDFLKKKKKALVSVQMDDEAADSGVWTPQKGV